MKTFYYFCESCGGDTALYEVSLGCPYCHARHPEFKLVAEMDTQERQAEVLATIGEFRARWANNHQGQAVGQAPRRRGVWARRRGR